MLAAALGSNQVSGAQGLANLCKRTFLDGFCAVFSCFIWSWHAQECQWLNRVGVVHGSRVIDL